MEVQVVSFEDYLAKRARAALRAPLHGTKPKRLSWLYFLTGNASAPKAELDRVGRFDEDFTGYGHEDLELGYRLQHGGVPIVYEPAAVNYHWHPVPWEEQQRKYELAGRSTVRFHRKHGALDVQLRLGMTPRLARAARPRVEAIPAQDLDRARRPSAPASRARSRTSTTTSPESRPPYVDSSTIARVSCGALTAADAGRTVQLNGWVHRRRDHGGLIFIDLRDRDGITQITFSPSLPEVFREAESLRSEDVVRVTGAVRRRPAGTENPRLPTGEVELPVDTLEVLNRAETPPFVVAADEEPAEELRLRYRYLDLRRPRMQRNLTLRHKIVKAFRDYFDEK